MLTVSLTAVNCCFIFKRVKQDHMSQVAAKTYIPSDIWQMGPNEAPLERVA